MQGKIISHGMFLFPRKWVELNIENAKDATQIVICSDGRNVGVYYAEKECADLTDIEEKEICELARQYGLRNCKLYGLVETELLEKLNISNVGNAMICRL